MLQRADPSSQTQRAGCSDPREAAVAAREPPRRGRRAPRTPLAEGASPTHTGQQHVRGAHAVRQHYTQQLDRKGHVVPRTTSTAPKRCSAVPAGRRSPTRKRKNEFDGFAPFRPDRGADGGSRSLRAKAKGPMRRRSGGNDPLRPWRRAPGLGRVRTPSAYRGLAKKVSRCDAGASLARPPPSEPTARPGRLGGMPRQQNIKKRHDRWAGRLLLSARPGCLSTCRRCSGGGGGDDENGFIRRWPIAPQA